jgi:formylglycine-generating enzyme required for sulfatase activity
MTPKIKNAIGRLRASRGDGGQITGTAFVVTDRHLLTAFHVVGDRAATISGGNPSCYPSLWFHPAGVESSALKVSVVRGASDPVADWALLEAEAPMSGISPLPLGEVTEREMEERQELRSIEFESWGFPTLARMTGSGIAISGRVQDRDAHYQDAWAYQLFSENAAAALGDPLNGLSGAPCLVGGAAVGIIRSNLIAQGTREVGPSHIAGGILYACPVATATLQDLCAQYLPTLDPIRGLPGLTRQELPLEPFRYLRWYGAEHAEVFFGRNRKLRELYFQVTDPDSPSVVLLYGASGVGKSSLLEAGLFPRLSWNYEVRSQRRDAAKTLVQSLEDQLASAQAGSQISGKPIVVVLDQIEEVFTDPRFDGNAELASLGERIKILLGPGRRLPKIILGFRSEWLANVRARLAEAKIPVSEFYLERLARNEIEDVVRGVVSTRRMQQFYGAKVDEDLPRRVADDLLSDPESPVSPVLSIVMTRLWAEAKANPEGELRLSSDAYDQLMRNRLDLDRFLAEQVKAVALTRDEDVASGLVNDVLYRHTTDHGTAKELSWGELRELYYQLAQGDDHSYLRGLVSVLSEHSLLYSVEIKNKLDEKQDEQGTRLAHDTLAAPVRKNYQKSDAPGQRAERRLASWVEDWHPSHPEAGVLDAASLLLIEQGARGMRGPSKKENEFIRASKKARQLAMRSLHRRRALVALLVAVMIVGPAAWWKRLWLREQAYWLMYVQALTVNKERALKPGADFTECTGCPKMVVVPAGSITVGSMVFPNEQPSHPVRIERPFAVAAYELTFAQWDVCVDYGDCSPNIADRWGRGPQPVTNVSWKDAQQYVEWLKRITGKDYRLLTEEEWEYAAGAQQSSTSSTYFSFGNDDAELEKYAWYEADPSRQTHPVGQKKPNAFGLYDMHGNVSEWVEDCYRESYRDVAAAGTCNRHVIRGGSYLNRAKMLRSAARDWADKPSVSIGIRIGRTFTP